MENTLLTNAFNQDLINHKCFNVAILMATHNGLQWISDQIDSIINQDNVSITLFISDDLSQDSTYDFISSNFANHDQIMLLPLHSPLGSSGGNFYRLILEVEIKKFDYVAFADQDDIWELDKLSRHIEILKANHADGVSSNVMAFWPDGRKKLLNKSQTQKAFDYMFESAGPGCTFLMTPWLVGKVREELLDEASPARDFALHDWLAYAVCRAHGRKWVIDSVPSVQYRQHQHNVLGANVGLKAKIARLAKLKQGWYKSEVMKIIEVCQRIQSNADVLKIAQLIKSRSFFSRLRLLYFVPQSRRALTDRLLLALCILLGLF